MLRAVSFKMGICNDPKCTALHFELKDKDDKPFAQMNMAVEHIPKIIEEMKAFAYDIIVLKGAEK